MTPTRNFISPLRYPGGKGRISSFLEDIIVLNHLDNCTLYELYAGGAGASLSLLLSGVCNKIVLNDLDYHIYAFWASVLNHTEELLKNINDVKVDIDTWHIQRNIYSNYTDYSTFEVGFSTFYLNRTNRSGILFKAGPIGGHAQTGNYKIDVRFNKIDLMRRIREIAKVKDKIVVLNVETIELLSDIFQSNRADDFVFLDPPYYIQGEHLYLNCYEDGNHLELQNVLSQNREKKWLLTYDNCQRINDMYGTFQRCYLPMSYTLQAKRKAKEIMMFSDNLNLPKRMRLGAKSVRYDLIEETIPCQM